MSNRRKSWALAVACAAVALSPPVCQAVSINLVPVGLGTGIGNTGIVSGPAPSSLVGGGTLDAVFQTAAQYWESLILDNYTVTVRYGWGDTTSTGILARTTTSSYDANSPFRPSDVGVVIRNQSSPNWFADQTAGSNSEYSTFQAFYANSALCNGASNCIGVMTTGLMYSGATGSAASNFDLLSVAIHEIGHALGLDPSYNAFSAFSGGYIPLSGPLPFAGAHIFDLVSFGELDGSQGNLGHAVMQMEMSTGERRLISQADLLAVCQVSQLTGCVTGQTQTETPEPATAALSFTTAIAFLRLHRRMR